MTHKTVSSPRGDVHYWISRCEDPNAMCIVFTHGLTANHEMFEKQVAFFAKDYTVITWDVPLHGLSRPYSDFSYENTAEELHAILGAEHIDAACLVGMSMGGYTSQAFADRYPDKIKGFVALDTTPFGAAYYSRSDKWWLRHVETMSGWFPDKMLRRSIAKSVSKTDYAYQMMQKMLAPLSKADIVRQMGIAYGGFLKENRDVHLECPVLILLGSHDKTGKMPQYCRKWAQKEGYPLHIIPGAAHFSNADNPEAVNREIQEFIRALAGAQDEALA